MKNGFWKKLLMIFFVVDLVLIAMAYTAGINSNFRGADFPRIRTITLLVYSLFISWILLLKTAENQFLKIKKETIELLFLFSSFVLFAISYEVLAISGFMLLEGGNWTSLMTKSMMVFSSGNYQITMDVLSVYKIVFLIFGVSAYSVYFFGTLLHREKGH